MLTGEEMRERSTALLAVAQRVPCPRDVPRDSFAETHGRSPAEQTLRQAGIAAQALNLPFTILDMNNRRVATGDFPDLLGVSVFSHF